MVILVVDTAHFHIEPIEERLAAIDVLLKENRSVDAIGILAINNVEAIRWINNIYA